MPDEKLAITAFLSHKYKAPAVNLYFFKLLSRNIEIQFEVDSGSLATNVTRLERLVKKADAFLGLYPYDEVPAGQPSQTELKNAARYFLLELDLAARSRKPGLVYWDTRFRGVLYPPAPIMNEGFDISEVVSPGRMPSEDRFLAAIQNLHDRVKAIREYSLASHDVQSFRVGILLPPETETMGYTREQVDSIISLVSDAGYEPIQFQWPPVLTPQLIGKIRELDWVVLDVGSASDLAGIVGYLHGEFKPAMRLLHIADADTGDTPPKPDSPLYSGFDVGYRKDIVRWWNTDVLVSGVGKRLATLDAPTKRISTIEEAVQYFQSAALRTEAVFVSYSGADQDEVQDILKAFRSRFQTVFDYRDGKSIQPGQPWLQEIFGQLAVSPIGVPILSKPYLNSGNCMHELQQMVARRDNKQMQIFPVRLEKLDPPEILSNIQYLRISDYSNPQDLVNSIVGYISK